MSVSKLTSQALKLDWKGLVQQKMKENASVIQVLVDTFMKNITEKNFKSPKKMKICKKLLGKKLR